MIDNIEDVEYKKIVDCILQDEEFNKISKNTHHGTDRLSHSIRVSYCSYLVSKKLGLDYEKAATAGLLHDFFISNYDNNFKNNLYLIFSHPKIASQNAVKQFGISDKERSIIETHMFPINPKPPKYAEGWVITSVDKIVGLFEDGVKFRYAATLWLIFLFNIMK